MDVCKLAGRHLDRPNKLGVRGEARCGAVVAARFSYSHHPSQREDTHADDDEPVGGRCSGRPAVRSRSSDTGHPPLARAPCRTSRGAASLLLNPVGRVVTAASISSSWPSQAARSLDRLRHHLGADRLTPIADSSLIRLSVPRNARPVFSPSLCTSPLVEEIPNVTLPPQSAGNLPAEGEEMSFGEARNLAGNSSYVLIDLKDFVFASGLPVSICVRVIALQNPSLSTGRGMSNTMVVCEP